MVYIAINHHLNLCHQTWMHNGIRNHTDTESIHQQKDQPVSLPLVANFKRQLNPLFFIHVYAIIAKIPIEVPS